MGARGVVVVMLAYLLWFLLATRLVKPEQFK